MIHFRHAVLTFTAVFLICGCAGAQDIFGQWKTIDDETGEVKSIVEIFRKDGKAFGRIVKLFRKPHEDQNPVCKECDDDRKGKRVIGMEILRNMEQDEEEWEDGTICDPKNGKVYDCKMWLDEENPDVLHVRGYLFFFYRTQRWERT